MFMLKEMQCYVTQNSQELVRTDMNQGWRNDRPVCKKSIDVNLQKPFSRAVFAKYPISKVC